jgi:hypothetical protein
MTTEKPSHPLDVAGHEHPERGEGNGHEQLDADDLDHHQRGQADADEQRQGEHDGALDGGDAGPAEGLAGH